MQYVTSLSLQKQVRIQLSDQHSHVPEQVCVMRPFPSAWALPPDPLPALIDAH